MEKSDSERSEVKGREESGGEVEREPATKEDVYNKLYAILTIMTLTLFAINILQVCLLPVKEMTNPYWIILFPLIIFVAFLAWASAVVYYNPKAFEARKPEDGYKENLREHARAFFRLQARHKERREWPRRFTRSSVLLTIILNVILVEFVYLPVFAVPAFKKITWNLTLHAHQEQMTPAVAVFADLNASDPNPTLLSKDPKVWDHLCAEAKENGLYGRCFAHMVEDWEQRALPSARVKKIQVRYAIFNPATKRPDISNLGLYSPITLYYPYHYDASQGAPHISIAFFDPAFLDDIDDFHSAYRCGLMANLQVTSIDMVNIRLRSIDVRDEINAMHRKHFCKRKNFERYRTYEASTSLLKPEFDPNGNNCDISSNEENGACWGAIQLTYESQLSSIYQSEHGKNWITILTEEGGVVGFVTFLTYFLGIFQMV